MDCCLHWLICRESQGQFQYYWASGSLNWGDYITKHHPPLYHESKRMKYGAKDQLTYEDDKSPPLDNQGKKRIQGIVGALLYYGRAVEKKLLVGLSSIGSQQSVATENTKEAINQLLAYFDKYPTD